MFARSGETLNTHGLGDLKSFGGAKPSVHCHADILHPGLGDPKSSEGAIPLVFVVPERLSVVW